VEGSDPVPAIGRVWKPMSQEKNARRQEGIERLEARG